jgi:AcrR family transcriptional regulator
MSAEQRHQGRRARLIDAAIELIGTRGVAATTVTAVCTESRVTSRYFYQHFPDRDALLRAVYEQVYASMQNVVVQAIPAAGATPDVLAYAPIRALVRMIEGDPRLARIVFVESGAEPILRQLRSELLAGFADLVVREARLHLDIADSALGVTHLASTLGVGGLFEVLRRWLDDELDYTADELITHCAGFLGSLGAYVLRQDTSKSSSQRPLS